MHKVIKRIQKQGRIGGAIRCSNTHVSSTPSQTPSLARGSHHCRFFRTTASSLGQESEARDKGLLNRMNEEGIEKEGSTQTANTFQDKENAHTSGAPADAQATSDQSKQKNVKIIRMIDEDDDIQFDVADDSKIPTEDEEARKKEERILSLKNKSVFEVGDNFQLELRGEPPYQSYEHIRLATLTDAAVAEERILQFMEDQLDDNVIPDYFFKGLLVLYHETRQYNLQDVIYTRYFFEGSQRVVDLEIVNCMISSYIQRGIIDSVSDIMHHYFGWMLKNEESGDILDKEPIIYPDASTVLALTSIAGNELSPEYLDKLLEDFRKQSHHGIINESVIFGFLEAAFNQLQLEDFLQNASGWMGYDGFSLTLQAEVKAVGSIFESGHDSQNTTIQSNEEKRGNDSHVDTSRSIELYKWIWNTFYTYYFNKMGDYAWLPTAETLELVIDSAAMVGDASKAEALYEEYLQGETMTYNKGRVYRALIRSYGKAGQLGKSERIFSLCRQEKDQGKNIFSSETIEAMIEVYSYSGMIVESVGLLRSLVKSRTHPDNEVEMSTGILNVLLEGLRKVGEHENMISLFEEFCGADEEKNELPLISPDMKTINYTIEAYVREGEVDVAFQIFNEYCNTSSSNRLPTTLYTIELLLQGLIQIDRVDEAAELFETYCMNPDSPNFCLPTVASIHLILRGLQKNSDGLRSIKIFSTFFSGNVPYMYIPPQADSVNILLQTLVLDKDFVRARGVFDEYFTGEDALEPNETTQKIMRQLLEEEKKAKDREIQYNQQLKREHEL